MELAVQTQGLYKYYEGQKVLNNLSLAVPAASIFGLIGPNGAGKSTLMRILTGISRPSQGDAFLLGRSIREKSGSIRARVGYVPDVPTLYPSFSVADMYRLASRLYPDWDWQRCRELQRQYALPDGQRIRSLSRGQAVQVSLVLALSIRPHLILLDEPTAGLDPVVRQAFMQSIIEEVAERHTTIFYSTHNLNDLEQSADYIASLWQGNLLFSSSLDELKESMGRIRMVLEDESIKPQLLEGLPGVLEIQQSGRVHTITFQGDASLVQAKLQTYKPLLLEKVDLSLEEIFLILMKERGYSYASGKSNQLETA
ncbi:MAG: ATP-binding cassette domain-containing protein [Methanobacterium sp.]